MKFAKIILEFKLAKNEFPIEYRKTILSFIKKSLSDCNSGKYYDKYFKDNIQKDYCFSVDLPGPKYKNGKIELYKDVIKVIFSADDSNKTNLILYSAFIKQKGKVFKLENNNSVKLLSVKVKNSENIVNSRAIFKTAKGSSICVREHNKEKNEDKYYIYSDPEFREKLDIVLKNELRSIISEKDIEEIVVNPIQCSKCVVKHYGNYIDTSIGLFEISAKPYILNYLHNVGIGSRKSAGFGMIELVTSDLV